MNGLDIFLIIIIAILVISGLVMCVWGVCEGDIVFGVAFLILFLIAAVFAGVPFMVCDRGSGSTIGEITSVDKNFFGTTAIYIKTSENSQEEYCIEDKDVVNTAKELIGKKVKVSYGERVGLYSTGACSQAPIEKIEEVIE